MSKDIIIDEIERNIKELKECCRLFHGRGHFFSGYEHLVIDNLSGLIFITTYHLHEIPDELIYYLKEKFNKILWRKRDKGSTSFETIQGVIKDREIIEESGLKFEIRVGDRQNFGFFLDMKEGRALVRELSVKKKVLNLFSYTCSFSVVALQAGAESVTNVDMRSPFLEWGRNNHNLNDLDGYKIKYLKHQIMKSLNGYRKRGPYDLIIIDPPTNQGDSFKLLRDYPKIIRRIHEWASESCEIIFCNNSPHMKLEDFREMIESSNSSLFFKKSFSSPSEFREKQEEYALKILHYSYQKN